MKEDPGSRPAGVIMECGYGGNRAAGPSSSKHRRRATMSSRSSISLGGRSGNGRAAARILSLLLAALHGPQHHPCADTRDREVAKHLDDEHYAGCLGFGGDVPETLSGSNTRSGW